MSSCSQSDSSQSQNSEQQFYEADQVVWAKVQGYPWWPGYVRSVYEENIDGEIQYSVHFFGDNQLSRLGQSKIRKFQYKYKEFYKSAKSNRRLKLSIQKAEQRLKQNSQNNVQIFNNIKNQIKKQQRCKRSPCKASSKIDLSDHNVSRFDIAQTNKIKSQDAITQKVLQQNQILDSQSLHLRKGGETHIQQLYQDYNKQVLDPNSQKHQQAIIEQIKKLKENSQYSQKEEQRQKNINKRLRKKIRKSRKNKRKDTKSKIVDCQYFQSSSQQQLQKPWKKKNIIILDQQSQQLQQKSSKNQQIQQSLQQQHLSQSLKLTIVEKVQFCIKNRQQLIKILYQVPITIDNIQDVLNLRVVNIIKDGQITNQIRFLLQFLKTVMLYKYFQNDFKSKVKYQKMVRKKKRVLIQTNNSQIHKIEDEYIQTNENIQIRKKTLIKLQKIIKNQIQQQQQLKLRSKQITQKIQSLFKKKDPTIGDQYKRFAYQTMRNLKDKKQFVQKVLLKIENNQYD